MAKNVTSQSGNNLCDKKPSGIVIGSQLDRYRGSLLDYAFAQGTDIIAAHVTCCNFPNGRELPYLWRTNLPALQAFLASATQGLYGKVSNVHGQVLSKVALTIDGQSSEIRSNGLFLALMVRFLCVVD